MNYSEGKLNPKQPVDRDTLIKRIICMHLKMKRTYTMHAGTRIYCAYDLMVEISRS